MAAQQKGRLTSLSTSVSIRGRHSSSWSHMKGGRWQVVMRSRVSPSPHTRPSAGNCGQHDNMHGQDKATGMLASWRAQSGGLSAAESRQGRCFALLCVLLYHPADGHLNQSMEMQKKVPLSPIVRIYSLHLCVYVSVSPHSIYGFLCFTEKPTYRPLTDLNKVQLDSIHLREALARACTLESCRNAIQQQRQ